MGIDVYKYALSNVKLFGPTIFSQVLATAFTAAEHCSQDVQNYTILLILTDGVIDDMEATIDTIVKYNDRPLSIVIVGVGPADFKNMDILDADDDPLRSLSGAVAKRDIVQFVPFRDFKNAPPSVLAKETLEEIPGQLLSYMRSRGIKPNPAEMRKAPAVSHHPSTLPGYGAAGPAAYPPPGAAPPGHYPPAGAPPGSHYPPAGAPPGHYAPPAGAPPGSAYPPPGAAYPGSHPGSHPGAAHPGSHPGYAPPSGAPPGQYGPPAGAPPGAHYPPPAGAPPKYDLPTYSHGYNPSSGSGHPPSHNPYS